MAGPIGHPAPGRDTGPEQLTGVSPRVFFLPPLCSFAPSFLHFIAHSSTLPLHGSWELSKNPVVKREAKALYDEGLEVAKNKAYIGNYAKLVFEARVTALTRKHR
ncbi:MAG: hypothetical protein BJ554DRAFT_1763 [Olpidium bornovanus]|uniref:Uncharacterized protein n=1 Tax=Olpidium bornovanus TaxID=278681 RepID=A0A8H7ZRW2_9FUNG|nr:MAG: hypothetical protein BJ554DRAFT_1763 [Olpidium bornovanus]